MTPENEGRLFRELGEINATTRATGVKLEEHIKRDDERHDDLKRRLTDLEGDVDDTQQRAISEVRAKAATLEADQKTKADDTRKARRETVRAAIMIFVGGLITIAFNAVAHALGLR